jgi:5-methylcytosine-specific restriction endonuclease McrA
MQDSFTFLQNKYTKWYFNIITSAKLRSIESYGETHHIIPKSLGGSNSKENLIFLSAREHFICHWLLTKMVENVKHKYQMWNAFSCMLYRENDNQERYKVNSKIFENIKKEGFKIKSIKFSGKNNPRYGIRREAHPSYGKELSIDRKEKIRQGVLNMPLHTCEHCGKTTTKGNYKRWHNDNCKVIKGELKFLD